MVNQNKKKKSLRKHPWLWLCLVAALYGLWELLGNLTAKHLYLFLKDPVLTAGQASSIGIIGGADGPTSVIVGVPRTAPGEQKKFHAACSALTFEPQKNVEWKMTFREKTVEDIEIQI